MEDEYKEVRFDLYCETCKHKDVSDIENPCDECLAHPANLNSIKPVNYTAKEKQ